MDAKNGQLMLVETHFKAEISIHPSVKAFKKGSTSPFFGVVTMWLAIFA